MKIDIYCFVMDWVIVGVIGGIVEYFNWNINVIWLLFVVLVIIFMFFGIIVYLIFWLLMKDFIKD